jgi:hypothetical protein
MKQQSLSVSTLVVSSLLAASCSGGGQGDSVKPASGGSANAASEDASESLGGNCTYITQPIGLDDRTSLGVTAAQLLAYVSGTRFATLKWGTSPDPSFAVYPTGSTTLAIDVTPMSGSITDTHADGGLCPGTLAIAATVHFVTADGGFDETWQESLFSSDGQSLTFYQDLQRTPLVGSFRVTNMGTPVGSTEASLTATFDERGARGEVQYVTSTMFSTGPNSGGGGGLIIHAASWVPAVSDAGDAKSGSAEAGDAGSDAQGVD